MRMDISVARLVPPSRASLATVLLLDRDSLAALRHRVARRLGCPRWAAPPVSGADMPDIEK